MLLKRTSLPIAICGRSSVSHHYVSGVILARHQQYLRKVGTRRAMAIAKVALGATVLLQNGRIAEIRLGAASVAPIPMRLRQTEAALLGRPISRETINESSRALLGEIRPIDDIRSTTEYRRRVAVNLLAEFLMELRREGSPA